MSYHKGILRLNADAEIARTCGFIESQVLKMRRKGAVIGLSGGIDSALCAELCVRVLGKDRVFGLVLPEKESSPVSRDYAVRHAEKLGISHDVVDITPILEEVGTYRLRDAVIRGIFPEYDASHKIKLTLPPDLLKREALNVFSLTIEDPGGKSRTIRLKRRDLSGITAATNTKQRTRMMMIYYYAEKLGYLVCGTTNHSETVQGFFVKHGDGGVDIEPIAHLYKTQVYQLSESLGVIQEIIERPPSPDTYSLEVSDEEFFFRLPYPILDLLLYAWKNQVPEEEVCRVLDLKPEQVTRAMQDLSAKYKTTAHLRELPPSLQA